MNINNLLDIPYVNKEQFFFACEDKSPYDVREGSISNGWIFRRSLRIFLPDALGVNERELEFPEKIFEEISNQVGKVENILLKKIYNSISGKLIAESVLDPVYYNTGVINRSGKSFKIPLENEYDSMPIPTKIEFIINMDNIYQELLPYSKDRNIMRLFKAISNADRIWNANK